MTETVEELEALREKLRRQLFGIGAPSWHGIFDLSEMWQEELWQSGVASAEPKR